MKPLIYALFVIATFLSLPGSGEESLTPVEEAIEESRFKSIEVPWLVQGILELPVYWFYLGGPSIKGVAYIPNFAARLGPKILYKNWGATLTFAIPQPSSETRRRGHSTQTDVIVSSFWRSTGYDLYYLKFKGFYVANPMEELKAHRPDRYPQLPDASVINYGINWYWVSNPDEYSLRAAFNQSEFQVRSGASWIYHPFYNHLELFLGKNFVRGSDPNSLQTMPNLASGRFDTLGFGVGYGYTYIHDKFFSTGQAALGPGVQFQRIFRGDDGNTTKVVTGALKINVNAAAGLNYNDYVYGMKFLVDAMESRVVGRSLSSVTASAQFFLGARF